MQSGLDDDEVLAKQIKAKHMAVEIVCGTPRDDASRNYDEREDLKAHYNGNPGVDLGDAEWAEPEGESLLHPCPTSSQDDIPRERSV